RDSARAMGMGGSFRVFSDGYSSYFGNPAGFAGMGSLTLLDTSVWTYIPPTMQTVSRLQEVAGSGVDPLPYIADWIINNGFGAGTSLGFGWAGRGFAIGANVVTDNVVWGNSLLGSKIMSTTQANALVGLGIPIRLGFIKFRIGADARVFYRMQSPAAGWGFNDIATAIFGGGSFDEQTILSALPVFSGYGFAADAGAILNIGPLMVGASVRDLGMEFTMASTDVWQILSNLDAGDYAAAFPLSGAVPAALVPQYAFGAGLRLFENGLFEPSVYLEVEDPLPLLQSTDLARDVFTRLHAGAQLRLLRFITARAGLNKGWISVGAGIDLALLEIDAALFTEEMGIYPGDKGRSGISIQAAVRFGR
ncbi:MAG: hypothetical protein N3A02_02950, partial [Rectinema sp.]|nr:hypothetical protein [Rectinema sp.]